MLMLAYQDTLLEVVEAFEAVVSLLWSCLSLHVPTAELLDASVVSLLPLNESTENKDMSKRKS